MYIFFLIIVLANIIVFLSKKRYFDFLTIYNLLLILYNSATIFGLVYIPSTGQFEKPNDYIYLISAFPFIFSTFFLLKKQPIQNVKKMQLINKKFSSDSRFLILGNLLLFLFFIVFFNSINIALNSSTKRELLENSNPLSLVLTCVAPLGVIISYLTKRKKILYIFFILTIILFLFGGRGRLVAVVLCLLLVYMYNKPLKIWSNRLLMAGGVLGLFVIILGKRLYGYILGYGLIDGSIKWYNDFDQRFFLTGSEFVTNSSILNAVVDRDFSVGWEDVFTSLFSILPIPVSVFGFDSGVFNDRFQRVLFSDIEYGMAYNIWAEGYSWLGLPGVVLFGFLIPFLLFKLWGVYNKYPNSIIGVIAILIGFILAFWIHRNSLGTILANIRNTLYPAIIIWFLAVFFNKLKFRR